MDPINREMMTAVLNWLIDLSLSLSPSLLELGREDQTLPFKIEKKKKT